MVVGLDLHIVLIPAPPPAPPIPTPIPIAFVGMVFDPAGLVVGAALGMAMSGSPGLVSVNGMPVTNCGTEVWGELGVPHVPLPGILFFASGAPVYTGNDAELFFGSYNVTIGGSYGVRLGEIAASCSDPIRMPTSLVLAIPKGLPVLNLAPMAPDLAMIAQQLALRGLASLGRRGARLFREFQQASPFFRRLSHALGGCDAPPLAGRLRQMWARATRFVTGHPVDVVTGNLFTEVTDIELPGPLPLTFERVYESAGSDRQSTLGFGWNHSLDESMWLERGRLVVRLGDGREIEFGLWHLPDRLVRPGDVLVNLPQKMRLHCLAPDRFELEFWDSGLIHVFQVLKHDRPSPAGTRRARLMEITTRTRDHAIRLTYSLAGDLDTVVDSGGRTLTFEHDALGRLTSILLPVPHGPGLVRRRTFHYDDAGDLVEVRDARGASYRYEYQGHLLVQETDRAGLSFYFQYDGQGASARCIRTWGDGGIYDHVIHYNAPARTTLVEDSCGATKLYTFDAQNRVLSLTDAHGAKTTFEYDEATGEVVREVMPTGRTMSTEVNALGKPTRLASSEGWSLALSYEATGELASMTDQRGRTWSWERDAIGRLLRRIEADGRATHYAWRNGLLDSVSESTGQTAHFEYDEAKNVSAIRDARGGQSKYVYDRLGQLTKMVNPLGSASRYRYDAEGHLTDVESRLGLLQRSTFDAEGNLLEHIDTNRHVRLEYGHFHRVTAREERAGFPIGTGQQRARVVYEYDTEDRLTAVINEAGERYAYTLDVLGRATAEVGFDGRVRTTQRDAKGFIRKTRSPNGTTATLTYDHADRLIAAEGNDGTFVRYAYDADGLLKRAENESSFVEFVRDKFGRIIEERTAHHSVVSTYAKDGLRSLVHSSIGARSEIDRDVHGLPTRLRAGGTDEFMEVAIEHDLTELESHRVFDNGIEVRWRRDRGGRPISQQTFRGTSNRFGSQANALVRAQQLGVRAESLEPVMLESRGIDWRGEDQIERVEDWRSGTREYDHDPRGRLIRERKARSSIGPNLFAEESRERAMDAVSNVYRRADVLDRHYEVGGRLKASGEVRFEHDEDGNRIRKTTPEGTWHYRWNGHGQLREVERPDGIRISFQYDAFARRIEKRVISEGNAPSITEYVWDGHQLLHEIGPSGTVTWHWDPESFAPVMREETGRYASITTDHLGTPTEMYDEMGAPIWKARLDLFGVCTIERGSRAQCPFRWPGQYEDEETGLYYNRFRYYDPSEGVYVSQDPIRLAGGMALYGYVADPLCEFDPFGEMRVTGKTRGGTDRASAAWRSLYGPAAMRDHHVLPQEFVPEVANALRLNTGLHPDDATVLARDFVDRTIARIPNSEHIALHGNDFNREWRVWFLANPAATLGDMRAQIRVMMARHGIAVSTTNQPRYCR